MSTELTLLWIIASIMSCWCFSVIVRTLSDWVATKRKRLAPQYNKKSKWIALAVFLLCAATAYFTASYAIELESEYWNDATGISTPIGIISASVCVFAGILTVWWFIGDRARGRIRCPRCWYDMSAAQNLICPECGNTAKSTAQFKNTRRPRWILAVSTMLLITGGTGFVLNQRAADDGFLGIMPNWMMLMGWEQYPDHWVYDTGKDYQDSSLTERIQYESIPIQESRKLAEELFDRMINDQSERWSPKNQAILQATFQADNLNWDYGENKDEDEFWIPTDDKLNRLFISCAQDILDGILNESPSAIETRILIDQSEPYSYDTYSFCSFWSAVALEERSRYIRFYQQLLFQADSTKSILSELKTETLSIDLLKLIHENDILRLSAAIRLLADTGGMVAHIDQFIEPGISANAEQLETILLCHAIAINAADEKRQIQEMKLLTKMVREGTYAEQSYAFKLLTPLSRLSVKVTPDTEEQRVQLVQSAFVRANELRNEDNSKESRALLDTAINAVTAFDKTGEFSYQIISESIKNNGKEPISMDEYQFYYYPQSDERVQNWISNFSDLTRSEHSSARMWLLDNLPEPRDSPHENQIKLIIEQLTKDPNTSIADEAEKRMHDRRAYHSEP
jgi:hypothetical protein